MIKSLCRDIFVETGGRLQFINITPRIKDMIKEAGFVDGILSLYNMHTTSGFWINENETGLKEDIKKTLSAFADENVYYQHDDFSIRTENLQERGLERKNGFAHIRSTLFNTNIALHVQKSQLELGKWQSLLYVELDGAQKRRIQVMMLGEFSK